MEWAELRVFSFTGEWDNVWKERKRSQTTTTTKRWSSDEWRPRTGCLVWLEWYANSASRRFFRARENWPGQEPKVKTCGGAQSPTWRPGAVQSCGPASSSSSWAKTTFFFVYQWDYSPMPKRCMTKSSIYDGNRKFGKKKKKSPLASNKENASAVLRHPPHFRRQITFLDTKKLIGKWPCVSRCVCAERINSHFRFHPFHRSEVLCVYILKAPPFFPLSLCTSPVAGFIFISSGSLEHFSLKCWQPSNTRELSIHRNICRVRSWLDCIKRWIGSTSHARPPLSFSLSLADFAWMRV